MVRLKIAYWEFDFEAVCPTLDHNLLSQAHISLTLANTHWLSCQPVTWATQSSPNQSKTEVNTHTEVTPCVSEKGVGGGGGGGGRKSVLWTHTKETDSSRVTNILQIQTDSHRFKIICWHLAVIWSAPCSQVQLRNKLRQLYEGMFTGSATLYGLSVTVSCSSRMSPTIKPLDAIQE